MNKEKGGREKRRQTGLHATEVLKQKKRGEKTKQASLYNGIAIPIQSYKTKFY